MSVEEYQLSGVDSEGRKFKLVTLARTPAEAKAKALEIHGAKAKIHEWHERTGE